LRLLIAMMVVFLACSYTNCVLASENDPIVRVRKISIEGNKVTKTSIIQREVTFKEGDYLSEGKINEQLLLTRSNIINTNLFLEVNVSHVIDSTLTADFFITVKERWYWSILPHLTLADRSFNEWWYERGRDIRRVTFGVDVRHSNFSGNADQLAANVHFGFVPLYRLSYSKPYIDKKKRLGASAAVYYSSQRNLAYRTWEDKLDFIRTDETNFSRLGGAVEFRYRKKHNYFHTFHLGYSYNSISDSVVTINPEYFGEKHINKSLISMFYEYRIDYRDVRQYPLKGNFFVASVGQYISVGGLNQTNLNVRYNHYLPLSKKLFLELGVRGKASFPREQSYFLVSGLGYGGNVARGYELYVVDGQYFMLSKNTLKLKAFERKFNIDWIIKKKQFSTVPITVYPNIFLDYAYVRNFYPERSNSSLGNRNLLGVGAGIDVVTFYNVNLRAYYSLNQMLEKKLFFAISRDF
jgi:outer membrane protein assembly factor BamA